VKSSVTGEQSEHFFATLGEGFKKAGTTIDAQGQPLTPDLFLNMIETIWINFDANGTAQTALGPANV